MMYILMGHGLDFGQNQYLSVSRQIISKIERSQFHYINKAQALFCLQFEC